MTSPLAEESTQDTINPFDMVYIVCSKTCDVHTAICGTKLRGEFVPRFSIAELCVVCSDLKHEPCPRCGAASPWS